MLFLTCNILKSLIHPRVKLKQTLALKIPVTAEMLLSTSSQCCQSEQKFAVASLYHLAKIDEVPRVIKSLKPWLRAIQATGRFQINAQGVNCQLCFKRESHVEKFKTRLSDQLGIASEELRVKVHLADFSVFKRLRVKQKLLEYLEGDADIEERGQHLNREEWNKKLDSDENALVLDIRYSSEPVMHSTHVHSVQERLRVGRGPVQTGGEAEVHQVQGVPEAGGGGGGQGQGPGGEARHDVLHRGHQVRGQHSQYSQTRILLAY